MPRPTVYRRVLALSIAVVGFAFCGNAAHAADAKQALPAYHFEVGQELTYKDDNEMKPGEGSKQSGYHIHKDWNASVVAKNKGGSYRVVFRAAQTFSFGGKPPGPPHTTVAYCDVFDDGRIISNPTVGFALDPTILFPRLPANSKELAEGWENLRDHDNGRCAFKVQSQPKSEKGEWTIAEVQKSPLDEIYLTTNKGTITFDPHRALVTKKEFASTRDWGSKSKGIDTLVLVSVEKHDAAWAKKLWNDADRYCEVSRAYEDKCELAAKDEKSCNKNLDEAKAILSAAEKELSLPLFKDRLKEALKSHDQSVKFTLEAAQRRAKVIGHPAAEFAAPDIQGKSHSLKDYKGKVVVLDFWYRGCSWCMRGMPQVKQLAAEFRGEPVAVIGMNIDPIEADAKFVVDKMQLDYPNLKIDQKLVEKYGVRGFPTMVIIDRQGNVHDLHVGYTPTLQREIGDVVRQLLIKR